MQPTNTSPTPAAFDVQPESKKHSGRTVVLLAVAACAVVAISISAYLFFFSPKVPQSTLRTFFTYENEVTDSLRGLTPTGEITIGEVQKWEDKTYELIGVHRTIDVDASKVYAYLSVAQLDAAALSYKAHKTFAGSVELISKNVLCEFYPDKQRCLCYSPI
jgi:hypothetical protein